ncbi:MAG: glycosyltransferase family 9 protein [Gemmatimonadaceae bacterium]|nr:glycosyltransferase family 9 protein [Gemmatimonadaceae bacterium]
MSIHASPAVAILMKNELLGDAITHVPAYRALRTALPDHRIVALYKHDTAWNSALSFARHEVLDDIRINQPIGGAVSGIRDALASIENLTMVLEFRANLNAWNSFLAASRMPVTYVANVAGFMLRRGVPHGIERRPESNIHCYHRVVELAVGRALPFDYHLTPPAGATARAAALMPAETRFMLLACGSPQSNKFWPAENWVGLARRIASKGIRPVFLIGVQEETERAWIARDVPDALIVDQAAAGVREQLPWLFVALAQRAVAAVTAEGGIGHLIATTGVPILTIAGPTNPVRWRPVTPHHFIAWAREFGSKETAAVPLSHVVMRMQEMLDSVAR